MVVRYVADLHGGCRLLTRAALGLPNIFVIVDLSKHTNSARDGWCGGIAGRRFALGSINRVLLEGHPGLGAAVIPAYFSAAFLAILAATAAFRALANAQRLLVAGATRPPASPERTRRSPLDLHPWRI